MRFYIATAFGNSRVHNAVRDALVGHGHEITYDWTTPDCGEGVHDPSYVAKQEIDGVLEADFVCILLPGGRGTHTELGVALGQRIPVFLHSFDEGDLLDASGSMCPFYYATQVARFHGSLSEYIEQMLHWTREGEFGA